MNNFDFTKLPWRGFFIGLVITFLVTSLHLTNLLPNLNFSDSKQSVEKISVFPKIRELLYKNKNTFRLNKKSAFIQKAYAAPADIYAESFITVDLDTGEIIGERRMNQRLPIASLTKIMTSVVALDLANKDEEFLVSQKASHIEPTKIGVVPGERMNLEELINAALLTSANDAIQVIKEGIDNKYNEEIFIKAMNEKAKFLGLNNTSFDNPQGFDGPNNFSTSEDLAILSAYALDNYPLIEAVAKKDYEYLAKNQNHKQFDLQNWNGLIGVYPGTIGLKIGNTDDAGKTTVVVSQRGGKRILSVVLGTPDILERDLSASKLLDQGYLETLGLPPVNVTQEQLEKKYQSWQYFD